MPERSRPRALPTPRAGTGLALSKGLSRRLREPSGRLMVSCIIEQNRQILVAVAQDRLPVPELPASCDTTLALAQAGATGR